MIYYDPDLRYTFKEYSEHEVAHKTIEQRTHLMYVDMAIHKPSLRDFDAMDLERMSTDELRALLGDGVKVKKLKPAPPVNPFPQVEPEPEPVIPQVRARVLPEWRQALPKYKAQLWHEGKPVHLGYFMSETVRDEEIAAAKLRRDIGLPIRLLKLPR